MTPDVRGGCLTKGGELGAAGDAQAGRALRGHHVSMSNQESRAGLVTGLGISARSLVMVLVRLIAGLWWSTDP